MPKRIKRERTKGWRMPPNTIYVGRPTDWGNPWQAGKPVCEIVARDWGKDSPSWFGRAAGDIVKDAADAVDMFRKWLLDRARRNVPMPLAQLRGKDLACWCELDQPCHADVLLELVNQLPTQDVVAVCLNRISTKENHMTTDNIERLRTDAVMAEELRRDIAKPLQEVCDIMNRAKSAGLVLNFNIAADQYGRFRAPEINIVKPL